jgi:hypothetical protein
MALGGACGIPADALPCGAGFLEKVRACAVIEQNREG